MTRTIQDLKQLQSLPLELKIRLTQARIRQWVNEYGEDGVYVSFSGGKDSTVLLHIVREMYPNIPAVFIDTGLEYPEIRDFVKTFDNVEIVKPKKTFKKVIERYGYPFINKEVALKVYRVRTNKRGRNAYLDDFLGISNRSSIFEVKRWKPLLNAPFQISHMCCDVMKKEPAHRYTKQTGRKPFTAQMTTESRLRQQKWIQYGCNMFTNNPQSNPMAFWLESDVLEYIKRNNIPICSVYGEIVYDGDELITTGCKRTGCMFCGFGCHMNKDQRFVSMKETHPKQYEWIMKSTEDGGLGYKEIIDWLNENAGTHIEY